MAKAISWVAVNKSGEVCLDSDVSPLPRGWERCLDLQSGVMYLKQMNSSSHNDSSARSRANREMDFHKRRKLLLDDNEGEGDPGLQLTLSLPTCSVGTTDCRRASHPQAQCDSSNLPSSLSSSLFERKCIKETHNEKLASTSMPSSSSGTAAKYACTINGSKPLSQKVHNKEDSRKDATTSSIESSPSYNTSSSSSCSPPSSQYKQFASQSHVLRANLLGLDQDRSLVSAAGCPHCFMYVIPSRINPKCPRCKSPILVDLSPLTIH